MTDQSKIRNFVIIAHVDHGKSTLADRLLEITGTIEKRSMRPQFLDQLELERERGITIKMAPVRMGFTYNNVPYVLNLIDTPGHSDFAYEVSRALAAVEGALLLVDATQGIQAQTMAVFESARKMNLKIIGAVNKVDVAPIEQVESARRDIAALIEVPVEQVHLVSGKTGQGVEEVLADIVNRIPSPSVMKSTYGKALVFDSRYDEHRGVIAFVRVMTGVFRGHEDSYLAAARTGFKPKEVGTFSPELHPCRELGPGEIGYIATGIKDAGTLTIGETVLSQFQLPLAGSEGLPGYREPSPVVFVSFYPEDAALYDSLRLSLSQLKLNDPALTYEPDMSESLGRGFKAGFLGQLHFEIAADRLEREFSVKTVHSFPSVAYQVRMRSGEWKTITNPKDFPSDPLEVLEPITALEIITPPQFIGAIMQLTELFRFEGLELKTVGSKTLMTAKLPLADLISDLDDKLKSVSQGFASLSYEPAGYAPAQVAKVEILVAGHPVPGLTRIVPSRDIERISRETVSRLKDLLPGQQFSQAIQAVIGGKIIARETIPALKKSLGDFGKNGGDRTRKMKLWKKQKEGKERLKERGTQNRLTIPASIFKELLKR